MIDESERQGLVQQAVAGDADALQRLIVHYHGPLYGTVEGRLNAQLRRHIDVDDILQEAYSAAFKDIGGCAFDGPGGFYKWLERIVLDRLHKTERDLHRQKRDIDRRLTRVRDASGLTVEVISLVSSPDGSPTRGLALQEASAAVLSSLARLTEDQRTIVRKRFIEDQPVAEIATEQGKTEAAIHMLSYRALKALRELMGSITQYLSRL